ncbi:MAG: hypothetical protein LBR23_02400 [Spirochaetaceae bacterium]|jgi:hypothetical protein|nr:hypothetical protein [Spirochaetaceae bacterium]
MYDSVWAYSFILLLCGVLCLRCPFQRRMVRDSLSMLAGCAAALCVLCFFAWGVSLNFIIVSAITLAVLLINLPCMGRFLSGLRHGRFSSGMIVGSFLVLPLAALSLCVIIYSRPVVFSPASLGVTVRDGTLTGSFTGGFTGRTGPLQPVNVRVTDFSPADRADAPLVLFVCDPRSSIRDYAPFLVLLAGEGFQVKGAEFFVPGNRRFPPPLNAQSVRAFTARVYSLAAPEGFAQKQGDFDAAAARDVDALVNLYGPEAARAGRKVFLLSDSNERVLAQAAAKYPATVTAWAALAVGPRAGFGCVEQTSPLLARYFGTQRDPTLARPRDAARKCRVFFSGDRL